MSKTPDSDSPNFDELMDTMDALCKQVHTSVNCWSGVMANTLEITNNSPTGPMILNLFVALSFAMQQLRHEIRCASDSLSTGDFEDIAKHLRLNEDGGQDA